jgi:hypothetical protein
MISYEEYVKKIKAGPAPAEFDGMYRAIGRKIADRQKLRAREALAGVVAILVIGFAAYFSYPVLSGGNGQLLSYVFDQQPEVTDGPVIDYVFSDPGTF